MLRQKRFNVGFLPIRRELAERLLKTWVAAQELSVLKFP